MGSRVRSTVSDAFGRSVTITAHHLQRNILLWACLRGYSFGSLSSGTAVLPKRRLCSCDRMVFVQPLRAGNNAQGRRQGGKQFPFWGNSAAHNGSKCGSRLGPSPVGIRALLSDQDATYKTNTVFSLAIDRRLKGTTSLFPALYSHTHWSVSTLVGSPPKHEHPDLWDPRELSVHRTTALALATWLSDLQLYDLWQRINTTVTETKHGSTSNYRPN